MVKAPRQSAARGSAAAYYPETNALVPLDSVADGRNRLVVLRRRTVRLHCAPAAQRLDPAAADGIVHLPIQSRVVLGELRICLLRRDDVICVLPPGVQRSPTGSASASSS